MQPHEHVERVTRMLLRSLPYPRCIQRQSSACFECEISSGLHVGVGCPATSPKSHEPWPFCAMSFPPPLSSFLSCFLCLWYPILGQHLQNPGITSSKLPYTGVFVKGLACGYWLPSAYNISDKRTTGLHYDTMWYDTEYVARHIGETSVLWVCCILLPSPVSNIGYPKCTANLHWVGVVIIEIWSNLPPVLWYFRPWIQRQPSGGQQACGTITSSGSRLSHLVRHHIFFIIAGQIIWIKRWLIRSWSRCGRDEIATRYAFWFNDRYPLMFSTVFILHIPQKALLVLDSIECLVLRIYIHSPVPLPKRSQLLERFEDMCRNQKHTRRWSHFSIVFGQHLSSYFHSEEQVFLLLSLLLAQRLNYTVHVIKHVVLYCYNVIRCNCMPFRHPQGPVSEWPQHFHDIDNNRPFVLSHKEWPVFTVFWIWNHSCVNSRYR